MTLSGGDTIQMIKTKEHLEKIDNSLNIEIILNPDLIKDSTANIIHIFNIQSIDETLDYIKECKKYNKKVVLSTIYWDLSHSTYVNYVSGKYNRFSYNKVDYDICKSVLKLVNFKYRITNKNKDFLGSKIYNSKRKQALIEADLLLPNSDEELEIISNEFDIPLNELKLKSISVPNAIDTNLLSTETSTTPLEIANLSDFVLCVSRLEPNKNQMGILKALFKSPEIPIVLIGKHANKKYSSQVKKIAEKRGNVYLIDEIKHDALFNIYKKAKVHVLASFRESPGLVTLEALAAGCEIVTASDEYCPAKFYEFDKYAHICDPYNIKSIKNAILEAYKEKRNTITKEYLHKFSYHNAAQITYSAYQNLEGK